MTRPRTKKDL